MEKKKIYYKYAIDEKGLDALAKEGGDNVFGYTGHNDILYYMPINGGAIEYEYRYTYTNYIKEHGIEINKKDILDDVEREYLSNFCRPFLKKIISVTKICYCFNNINKAYLFFLMNDDDNFYLPNFKANTMYKNMKDNKTYTIEELNLR